VRAQGAIGYFRRAGVHDFKEKVVGETLVDFDDSLSRPHVQGDKDQSSSP
jgi:hypothetical protein